MIINEHEVPFQHTIVVYYKSNGHCFLQYYNHLLKQIQLAKL